MLISKKIEDSAVDHTDSYDTTSIIKLLEERYNLRPLGPRDQAVQSLKRAIAADIRSERRQHRDGGVGGNAEENEHEAER